MTGQLAIADDPATIDAPALLDNLPVAAFDPGKHDGRITIRNAATGGHRTFQLRTARRGHLKGKRIVALLVGPCNDDSGDWQSFGFADEFGVRPWQKFRSVPGQSRTSWEIFADMLGNPAKWQAKGAEYIIEARCRRCSRVLTAPGSAVNGIGPECEKKGG